MLEASLFLHFHHKVAADLIPRVVFHTERFQTFSLSPSGSCCRDGVLGAVLQLRSHLSVGVPSSVDEFPWLLE